MCNCALFFLLLFNAIADIVSLANANRLTLTTRQKHAYVVIPFIFEFVLRNCIFFFFRFSVLFVVIFERKKYTLSTLSSLSQISNNNFLNKMRKFIQFFLDILNQFKKKTCKSLKILNRNETTTFS